MIVHDQHQIVRQEGPVSIQLQIQSDKSRGTTSHPLKIHQKGIERQSELQFVHIASSISKHIYTFFYLHYWYLPRREGSYKSQQKENEKWDTVALWAQSAGNWN